MMKKKILFFICSLMIISFYAVSQTIVDKPASLTSDTTDKVYSFVQVEAEFPGGFKAWIKYLEANIKNETPVKSGAPDGIYKVMISFVVTKEGKITDIKNLSSTGYGMEQEAIRVLQQSPDWIPAIRYGRKVNSIKRQAFSFVIRNP